MPFRVSCPMCGTTLTVSDAAPRQLTCPRCLAKIERPASQMPLQPRPQRVIPLDEEAGNDSRFVVWIVVILIGLVGVGILLPLMAIYFWAAAVLLAVAIFGIGLAISTKRAASRPPAVPPPLPPVTYDSMHDSSPPVLHYSSIRRPEIRRRSAGAFALGFFAALGVCAGGFALLGTTFNSNGGGHGNSQGVIYLLIVVAAVIAIICLAVAVGRRPTMYGFGQGVAVGLCLGMLALGPCAFCYLLTLQ